MSRDLEPLLNRLRAAAEPTRLRLLAVCAQGEWTVSELTQVLGQSQPRVSRHLKVLADAGLLERFPEGNWVFYRLDRREGADLNDRLVQMLPNDADVLLADRRQLRSIRAERQEKAETYFDAQAAAWDRVRDLTVADATVDAALRKIVAADPPVQLLDIGTGTGHVLRTVADLIDVGIGVDLSRDMLAVARVNLQDAGVTNCQVRHGDMYRLPVPENSCDCVVLHQVLHFAVDPRAALDEAARTLRSNGRLIVIDLAPHDVEQMRTDYAHRRLGFDTAEMEGWLSEAGLNLVPAVTLPGRVTATILWQGKKPEPHVLTSSPRSAVA